MKLRMLATTAVTTSVCLMPALMADSTQAQQCEEMLAIRDVVVMCQKDERTSEINQIYREVLGREADVHGLKTWSEKLQRSNLRKVRHEIAQSDEAESVLNRIYQEVLGRSVDRSGLKTYKKKLTKNWTLSDVRRDIERSEEAMKKRLALS